MVDATNLTDEQLAGELTAKFGILFHGPGIGDKGQEAILRASHPDLANSFWAAVPAVGLTKESIGVGDEAIFSQGERGTLTNKRAAFKEHTAGAGRVLSIGTHSVWCVDKDAYRSVRKGMPESEIASRLANIFVRPSVALPGMGGRDVPDNSFSFGASQQERARILHSMSNVNQAGKVVTAYGNGSKAGIAIDASYFKEDPEGKLDRLERSYRSEREEHVAVRLRDVLRLPEVVSPKKENGDYWLVVPHAQSERVATALSQVLQPHAYQQLAIAPMSDSPVLEAQVKSQDIFSIDPHAFDKEPANVLLKLEAAAMGRPVRTHERVSEWRPGDLTR